MLSYLDQRLILLLLQAHLTGSYIHLFHLQLGVIQRIHEIFLQYPHPKDLHSVSLLLLAQCFFAASLILRFVSIASIEIIGQGVYLIILIF
jgi:hypothetical protein